MTSEFVVSSARGRFAGVPLWLIERLKGERGSEAIVVFAVLDIVANYEDEPDMPGDDIIAGTSGLSIEQVAEARRRLIEVGAIEVRGEGDYMLRHVPPERRGAPA